MEKTVYHSPLDKNESWAEIDKRTIQITQSSKGDPIPTVYLGIIRKTVKGKEIITEDLFLLPADALEIGEEIVKQAKLIYKAAVERTSKIKNRTVKVLCEIECNGILFKKGTILKDDGDKCISFISPSGKKSHYGVRIYLPVNSFFNRLISQGKVKEITPKTPQKNETKHRIPRAC